MGGEVSLDRPKHPKREGEDLLREAETRGCTITRGKGYFKMKCPCGDDMLTIHLTPQRGHFRAKLRLMQKWSCWDKEAS